MPPLFSRTSLLFLLLASSLSLTACQSNQAMTQDCQRGDWLTIGKKDGEGGLTQRFEKRNEFCQGIKDNRLPIDAQNQYTAGWHRGNADYWYALGETDGKKALSIESYQSALQSKEVVDKKTPANHTAYREGWQSGNGQYWFQIGFAHGSNGGPRLVDAQAKELAPKVDYNSSNFHKGWDAGNNAYWAHLGAQDAKAGLSSKLLQQHMQRAQSQGTPVQEAAYNQAYDIEIVEYWKRVAWEDATHGWDVRMRRMDAQKREIKFVENAYQSMWEQRLQKYWQDAGQDDGFGHPNRLQERLNNLRRDQLFATTQTEQIYTQAWHEANARYCSPPVAFDWGMNQRMYDVNLCHPNSRQRVIHAYENGQQYRYTESEYHRLDRDVDHLNARMQEWQTAYNKIDRDYKKDINNKDRVITDQTKALDKQREQDMDALRHKIREGRRNLDGVEADRHRVQQQMHMLKQNI